VNRYCRAAPCWAALRCAGCVAPYRAAWCCAELLFALPIRELVPYSVDLCCAELLFDLPSFSRALLSCAVLYQDTPCSTKLRRALLSRAVHC
jgi:hypothetical protein